MRVIALDIGERRVGVAVSDPQGAVATPVAVFDASLLASAEHVRELVSEWDAGLIVVGLPLTMRGLEGPQAERTREAAERIAAFVDVPVTFYDERLSSAEAKRAMREAGVSEKKARGSVDKVAAALFLQSFLDSGGAVAFEEARDADAAEK